MQLLLIRTDGSGWPVCTEFTEGGTPTVFFFCYGLWKRPFFFSYRNFSSPSLQPFCRLPTQMLSAWEWKGLQLRKNVLVLTARSPSGFIILVKLQVNFNNNNQQNLSYSITKIKTMRSGAWYHLMWLFLRRQTRKYFLSGRLHSNTHMHTSAGSPSHTSKPLIVSVFNTLKYFGQSTHSKMYWMSPFIQKGWSLSQTSLWTWLILSIKNVIRDLNLGRWLPPSSQRYTVCRLPSRSKKPDMEKRLRGWMERKQNSRNRLYP